MTNLSAAEQSDASHVASPSTIEHRDTNCDAQTIRYAQEALYCERILAKTGDNIVTATLAHITEPTFWTHYPDGDVFDTDTGAHWYYHSHAPGAATESSENGDNPANGDGNKPADESNVDACSDNNEHGHFHCFVRPQGKAGPIHHLVAVSVDAHGQLLRLFTVAQHVVNDNTLPAHERIALLEKFDVQLGRPSYLVNRWLTAIVGLYQEEITRLIQEGDAITTTETAPDVTAELKTTLAEKMQTLT